MPWSVENIDNPCNTWVVFVCNDCKVILNAIVENGTEFTNLKSCTSCEKPFSWVHYDELFQILKKR